MRSIFADMTAEDALRSHQRTVLSLRVQHILMVLVFGAMALVGIKGGALWLYALGLAGIIATFLLFFYRFARVQAQLQDILWQDADVVKYRAVLERYLAQTRRRSAQNMLALELAFCDYFDGLDDDALARLAQVTFKGKRNTQLLRALNLKALLFDARGDLPQRDEALGGIREMAARYRAGSKMAQAAGNLVRDLELRFTPPAQWDEADARFIRAQIGMAEKHVNRVGLRLRLDAYDLAHGRVAEAVRDLNALSGEPIVPRYETMRIQLLHTEEI